MRPFFILTITLFFAACQSQTTSNSTKDIVMTVNLVDDEEKIAEYLKYHREIWPEVEAGFRKAGFEDIRIYKFGRQLTMIITIPASAELDELSRISGEDNPRMAEWNELMAQYQEGVPGTEPGQTWVRMEKVYDFDK